MNGWRYEWVESLPVGIYDLLLDWLQEQQKPQDAPAED